MFEDFVSKYKLKYIHHDEQKTKKAISTYWMFTKQ